MAREYKREAIADVQVRVSGIFRVGIESLHATGRDPDPRVAEF